MTSTPLGLNQTDRPTGPASSSLRQRSSTKYGAQNEKKLEDNRASIKYVRFSLECKKGLLHCMVSVDFFHIWLQGTREQRTRCVGLNSADGLETTCEKDG